MGSPLNVLKGKILHFDQEQLQHQLYQEIYQICDCGRC